MPSSARTTISDCPQTGKRHPDPLHPTLAGGLKGKGTDSPVFQPAVPRSPHSLFRHVLQLHVVHLQSSPQMQMPPAREGRATDVRAEWGRGTPCVLPSSPGRGFWAVPGQPLDRRVKTLPSVTPYGEDPPVIPSPSSHKETGAAASAPSGDPC